MQPTLWPRNLADNRSTVAPSDTAAQLPRIMGILNVTPDSFSDGGHFVERDVACRHALQMVAHGATLIDVGGESSRPGAAAVSSALQIERVVPVISELRSVLSAAVTISIDARDPEVAHSAIDAGAGWINDISGGANSEMLALAAERQVPVVLMHMQGSPETMQDEPQYEDVVSEIRDFLLGRADKARTTGVKKTNIVLDPGIGFGKSKRHNLEILGRLNAFTELPYPILLGTSRKRFMGAVCRETEFKELLGATCATTALGAQAGVRYFRVHDVRANRQAMEVGCAISNFSNF